MSFVLPFHRVESSIRSFYGPFWSVGRFYLDKVFTGNPTSAHPLFGHYLRPILFEERYWIENFYSPTYVIAIFLDKDEVRLLLHWLWNSNHQHRRCCLCHHKISNSVLVPLRSVGLLVAVAVVVIVPLSESINRTGKLLPISWNVISSSSSAVCHVGATFFLLFNFSTAKLHQFSNSHHHPLFTCMPLCLSVCLSLPWKHQEWDDQFGLRSPKWNYPANFCANECSLSHPPTF